MKLAATCAFCILLVFAPACSLLTPQQRDTVRQTVESEFAAGSITKSQRDAAIEALDQDEPYDWTALGLVGANIALALIGAPAVVRLQRGPAATATERIIRKAAKTA